MICCPVVALTLTSRRAVTPFTVANDPPRKMPPSGLSASALISPSTLGTNVVSIVPLPASKAKMLFRVRMGPPPAAWTWVNKPAATIRLPTGSKALI